MVTFRAVTREEMAANHSKFESRRGEFREPVSPPRAFNVEQVLDLGNVVYFTFRGAPYGVPPLGWRAGAQLQAIWTEAIALESPLTVETSARYYQLIGQIPALLWRHCFPAGKLRRLFRFFRVLRNPFRAATEAELAELAAFFLARRSSSNIGLPAIPTMPDPGMRSRTFANSRNSSRRGSTPTVSR